MKHSSGPRETNTRIKMAVFGLLALMAASLAILLAVSRLYPPLFGPGILALVLGLRHAVDADHIAAIDNTTRKLMNDGQKPLGVGFFFSVGHSTIVFGLFLGIAFATRAFGTFLKDVDNSVNMLATLVSALFLYLIALLNLVILRDIYRIFQDLRRKRLTPAKRLELEEALLKRGLMNRVLGRFYEMVKASWQMYPVGLLFGFGFDTPTEMALLAMSALVVGKNVPIWATLALPLVFSAGTVTIDSLDGMVMQSAYSWAFLHPIRKVYYNLSITTISVLIALGVGTVEALQILGTEFSLKGAVWDFLQGMDFETMGYIIIGILLVSWVAAAVLYRVKGYETGMDLSDPD